MSGLILAASKTSSLATIRTSLSSVLLYVEYSILIGNTVPLENTTFLCLTIAVGSPLRNDESHDQQLRPIWKVFHVYSSQDFFLLKSSLKISKISNFFQPKPAIFPLSLYTLFFHSPYYFYVISPSSLFFSAISPSSLKRSSPLVMQSFGLLTVRLADLASLQYSLISTPTGKVRFRQIDFIL